MKAARFFLKLKGRLKKKAVADLKYNHGSRRAGYLMNYPTYLFPIARKIITATTFCMFAMLSTVANIIVPLLFTRRDVKFKYN